METTPSFFSPFDLLPLSLVALILRYLGTEEKLMVVPLVCKAWRRLCRKEPLVWQIIDLSDWEDGVHHAHMDDVLPRLARLAGKELRKLDLQFVNYDELANVVSECQGSLEWLRVGHSDMTSKWAREYGPRLSKLKHLELLKCGQITRAGVAAFGRNCPSLRHLSVEPYDDNHFYVSSDYQIIEEEEKPSDVETQLQELLFILTILSKFPKLDSLTFPGKWIDFDVKCLSDSAVRARLSKDVRKRHKYVSKAGAQISKRAMVASRKYPFSRKPLAPIIQKMTRR